MLFSSDRVIRLFPTSDAPAVTAAAPSNCRRVIPLDLFIAPPRKPLSPVYTYMETRISAIQPRHTDSPSSKFQDIPTPNSRRGGLGFFRRGISRFARNDTCNDFFNRRL